ncbi:MAG TPA: lipoprotein [Steroidobacteraceae bacterium]
MNQAAFDLRRLAPPLVVRISAALLLAAAICGCGQKGPLYLPQKTQAVIAPVPAELPPPAGTPPSTAAPVDATDGSKKKQTPAAPAP